MQSKFFYVIALGLLFAGSVEAAWDFQPGMRVVRPEEELNDNDCNRMGVCCGIAGLIAMQISGASRATVNSVGSKSLVPLVSAMERKAHVNDGQNYPWCGPEVTLRRPRLSSEIR